MPQLELDYGDSYDVFVSLDEFTRGYIECAFFCGVEGVLPDVLNLGLLAPETWEAIKTDCNNFQLANAAALTAAIEGWKPGTHSGRRPYSMNWAGNDFWYTRNGHGSGFWDRGFDCAVEEALVTACKAYRECDLYLGDDGKLYI